jgi:FKBP-type peptidyl-prolyl cis-trans isomerase SlyD
VKTDEYLTVADDLVVSMDYTLRLDDEEIIDSSAGREPLEFLQGHGQIIPGLEQALYGMVVGEEKKVVIAPRDGYGERESDAVQEISRESFPADVELEPGMALELRDSSGQPLVAFIADVRPDSVLLDLNHPLAGETLHFNVSIADLRAATTEELTHGHVHGAGGAH